ncbi:unnamed protein product [Rotaria magnacalcarata]|uniref:Lysosomal-associated transmembrane protein 4A n=6 Tax=Rotaria magnacalcarata TaxID=392030 RepID=A0A814Y459_9BILA|nr:unnamed protein product [Rotaria magnacalcarata]CAF1343067.1 unnamed protein product [Rotaria magnacalcarata]
MVITTINIERDIRRRYNRRILFCIRIKGAALLIGCWDLVIHSVALCAIILMFGRAPTPSTQLTPINNELYGREQIPFIGNNDESSVNFISNHVLLNHGLEKRNKSQSIIEINSRNFYSHWDLMTIHWVQSLSKQDKYIVFAVIFSATIFILAHLCGVVANKPSYIVPYFLIKVFNVIIAIITMLGFYAYLPDIRVWVRMQPHFPYKNYLLEFDSQTLQLIVFTFLLFLILFKLYIAAIIWYCYGYVTALTMARTLGTITTHSETSQPILEEMYSPPKYEEAIKSNSDQEDYAPPPYTPLLSS